MEISVECFEIGPVLTNAYLVCEKKEKGACIVIDPSSGCKRLLDRVKSKEQRIVAILLTHGHFDHIMGIGEIIDAVGEVPVYINPADISMLVEPNLNLSSVFGEGYSFRGKIESLNEGTLVIAPFTFTILHTSGHTPGGCTIVIGNHCFSGDTLFAGSIGRCDFPGSDLTALLTNIKLKLFSLPDTTIVYPGHGGRTTIGREKRCNQLVR